MTRLSKTPDEAVQAGNTSKNAERGRLRAFRERLRAMARSGGVHLLSKILADENMSLTRVIFGVYCVRRSHGP